MAEKKLLQKKQQQQQHRKPASGGLAHFRSRFGLYSPILLAVTMVSTILAVSMLLFLWNTSRCRYPSSFRSQLALSGWTVPIIAICSATIRTSVATQLGIACTMAASLAFEHGWVVFGDTAAVSIQRYVASGPYPMFFPFWRGLRTPNGGRVLGVFLLAQLIVVNVLINVTSTILVRDTGVSFISGTSEEVMVKYDAFRFGLPSEVSPFLRRPAEFPLFGEMGGGGGFLEPAEIENDGDGDGDDTAKEKEEKKGKEKAGVSDYGPLYRALVPLERAERETLLYYDGLARVVDAHVLCTSPGIAGLAVGGASADPNDDRAQLYANVTAPRAALRAWSRRRSNKRRRSNDDDDDNDNEDDDEDDKDATRFGINCAFKPNQEFNLCPAEAAAAAPSAPARSAKRFPSSDALDPWNTWWVVVRGDGSHADGRLMASWANVSSSSSSRRNGSEWTHATLSAKPDSKDDDSKDDVKDDAPRLEFTISLCVAAFRSIEATVVLDGASRNYSEPRAPVVPGLIPTYDTAQIRKQLLSTAGPGDDDGEGEGDGDGGGGGVGSKRLLQRRGVFNISMMEPMSMASPGPVGALWGQLKTDRNSTVLERAGFGESKVHPIYGGLFVDVMRTGNGSSSSSSSSSKPARALQSILWLVTANGYYDQLDTFDGIREATLRFAKPVVIPVGIVGLCLVNAIIWFHLINLLLVSWLFFWRDSSGSGGGGGAPRFLDQAWAVVAQVAAGRTVAGWPLAEVGGMGDREVERSMRPKADDNDDYDDDDDDDDDDDNEWGKIVMVKVREGGEVALETVGDGEGGGPGAGKRKEKVVVGRDQEES